MDTNTVEELRNDIVEKLSDTIIRYSKTKQELRSKIEETFAIEERDGLPRDINLYRVYKELTK